MRTVEHIWNTCVSIGMFICWHMLTGRGKQKVSAMLLEVFRGLPARRKRRR